MIPSTYTVHREESPPYVYNYGENETKDSNDLPHVYHQDENRTKDSNEMGSNDREYSSNGVQKTKNRKCNQNEDDVVDYFSKFYFSNENTTLITHVMKH